MIKVYIKFDCDYGLRFLGVYTGVDNIVHVCITDDLNKAECFHSVEDAMLFYKKYSKIINNKADGGIYKNPTILCVKTELYPIKLYPIKPMKERL